MQPITVAIVETDPNQRAPVERFVRQDETDIKLLTDTSSNYDSSVERRLVSRDGITSVASAIARIKRLKPRVLLVNANESSDAYCDLLLTLRHQCPDTG